MPVKRHSWIDPDAFRTEADGQELAKMIEQEKKRQLPPKPSDAQQKLSGQVSLKER